MKGSSILKALVIVIAAIFIINQVVSSVYSPIGTETAVYYTAVDGMKITGVIIRNETLIHADKSGVLHFAVEDGNRVSKNGVIANIYNSESASITVSQIRTLEQKIADIEDILSYNDMAAANINLINEKVTDRLNSFVVDTADGKFDNAIKASEEFLYAVNRKQAATGTTVDFSLQLTDLKSQLSKLNSSLPTVIGSINADESGYFVSKTDGYEQILMSDDLTKVTPEFLNSISPAQTDGSVIGKIVSDYEWYIAAEVTLDESMSYREGEELTLQTSLKTAPELSVKVEKINVSNNNPKAVLIFSCNLMNTELATMRSGQMTVIKAKYDGLKIPKKSIRIVNSQSGVYVLNGMQVNFVPIKIVYRTDGYVICEKQSENNVLKLYDKVVVKGKNLYDGKIVG